MNNLFYKDMVVAMYSKYGIKKFLMFCFMAMVCGVPAYAQNEDLRDEIRIQIFTIGTTLIPQGYELTHEIVWGRLSQGVSENISIDLYANEEYYIMGFCDYDCYNLDVTFYDSIGNRLGYDYTYTNQPFVHVPNGYDGRYIVKISMEECVRSSCNYAMAVFGR